MSSTEQVRRYHPDKISCKLYVLIDHVDFARLVLMKSVPVVVLHVIMVLNLTSFIFTLFIRSAIIALVVCSFR